MTRPDFSDALTRADTQARLDAIIYRSMDHRSVGGAKNRYLRVDAEYRWPGFDVAPTRVQP